MMKKYPFFYYLILFLLLVAGVIFWYLLLSRYFKENMPQGNPPVSVIGQPSYIRGGYYTIKPIDRDKVIIDTISRRKIVSDLVNIAIKDTVYQTHLFVKDFAQQFDTVQYRIRYIDSTINYVQVKVKEQERMAFKQQVKQQLSKYPLLVWDEALFDKEVALDANDHYWRMENLYPIRSLDASHLKVAVIDNGFDLKHLSIANKWIKPYNATDNSQEVSPSAINHGTAVASLILGNQFQDIHGMIPSCKLIPIKVADANGFMTSTYIVKGLLYAVKNHADVVNISLGANLEGLEGTPEAFQKAYIDNEGKDEEAFWKELFQYAEQNKTVVVLAAGNDNVLTGFDPFQRSEITIKVGAVNKNNQKADFSNYGAYTTLYAPGEELKVALAGGGTEITQGTSFAAPIVSAFLIALRTKYPQLSAKELIAQLMKNTTEKNQLTILYNKTF
ncbi:S8/S53 family peptidase [uncultured Capnocytophaga sp.]|jgi:serine protease|uniref:S8 family peptidase n=1 Tax=uncultured Capnocytophaga sp. TaxID=159273 RepID=UPI0028892E3B|nr:S8/S53 family peptidase [uncultured Capnocytophaga sp.]